MAENCYFYLNLTPESLVASQLEPLKFGTYMATGTQKRTRGEVIYFEVDAAGLEKHFDLEYARKRCVPAPDGRPKHSVYVSIYRVLEHVPLGNIGRLYLTTRDGRTLELSPREGAPELPGKYHLYQELGPVHPLIASIRNPADFIKFMTDSSRSVHVPRLAFVDMELGDMADEPMTARPKSLPYENLEHIRYCLAQLSGQRVKDTKTVNRMQPLSLPYRTIRSGFYVGDASGIKHWPFPSHEDLDRYHHEWWRSAQE